MCDVDTDEDEEWVPLVAIDVIGSWEAEFLKFAGKTLIQAAEPGELAIHMKDRIINHLHNVATEKGPLDRQRLHELVTVTQQARCASAHDIFCRCSIPI